MDGNVATEFSNPPISYCVYCKQGLQYPIRKVENIGNLCGSCYEKSAYTTSLDRSTELEYVLVNLLMPCKYSYRGCDEKGKVLAITQHEKRCSKRDIICPLFQSKNCIDPNHMPDIIQHFSQCHQSHVHISDGNRIDIKYDITADDFNKFWLIAFKDDNILVNAKLVDEKLQFLTYYIGNTDDMRNLTCKMQHSNNDNICTQERICNILHEKQLGWDEIEEGNALCFDRQTLEIYFGQCLNTTITLERDILNINNDDILTRLECPVCSNYMRTNIMLCTAGHSVCNECESKLDKCPMCTAPFCGARNFGLESVGDLLKVLIRGEKLECPLRKELQCLWKGVQADVLEHMKDCHRDKIVLNKNFTRVFKYSTEFCQVNYLMTFGQVFKFSCKKEKHDDIMSIIIELIGHDEDAQKYRYNVSFNSLYKQNIIWYTKSKVLTRRRIEYHVDYLAVSRIVCNDEFNISYTIMKNRHYL